MVKFPLTMSREELRKIAEESSDVVAWYPHPEDNTIRGPFGRWLQVIEGGSGYPGVPAPIATAENDTRFTAAAMNNLVPLLDELDAMERKIVDLQLELILMGRIIE